MTNQVEMMDKKRRKLLTINLVFIFVYLIVMMWEFMSVQKPGYPYHRIVISDSGEIIIENPVLTIKSEIEELDNLLKDLKQEDDFISDLKEKASQNSEELNEQLDPQKAEELDRIVKENIDKASEMLNTQIEQNEKLIRDPHVLATITNNIETPHFFWVVLLVLQLPMSLILYNMSKKIKKDPELDSALNNELVQFNRFKAWRTAFFTSIIALFILAVLQYQSYFGMGWVAAFTASVGFAAYLIKFLKLDREGEYGE